MIYGTNLLGLYKAFSLDSTKYLLMWQSSHIYPTAKIHAFNEEFVGWVTLMPLQFTFLTLHYLFGP